jgi:UDP-glucose 4-epimerase
MSARYLVTGGAGFIGSHLVDRLVAEGNSVTVIDDLSTGRRENLAGAEKTGRVRFVQGEVSKCENLKQIAADCAGIFHLAAAVGVELVIKSPIETIRTNLDETEALLEAAPANAPVLVASTSEVYGKSAKAEFAESDDLLIGPPNLTRWSYACSKLMDEFLALSYFKERKLPVRIARLFNTVGPRQTGRYGMVLPRFIAAAKAGEPLRVFGDGEQRRCFCYVDDCVEALLRLLRLPAAAGEVVNVGSVEEVSVVDLARRVIAILGSKSAVELVPYDKAYAPGFEDMVRRKPAIEKLAKLTGFRPRVSLDQIIRRTADY